MPSSALFHSFFAELLAGDTQALYQNAGRTESGAAHRAGQMAVVGQRDNVLQQFVEVTGYGQGLDIGGLLTIFDHIAGRLQGKVSGNGIRTGVQAAQIGDIDAVSCLGQQLFLGQVATFRYMVKGRIPTGES